MLAESDPIQPSPGVPRTHLKRNSVQASAEGCVRMPVTRNHGRIHLDQGRVQQGWQDQHYVAFESVADNVTGPYRHITWLNGAG